MIYPNRTIMPSIDKVALTCKLLLDARVLEQRREIELMRVKLFWRDYRDEDFKRFMAVQNSENTKCKCIGCVKTGRTALLFGDTHQAEIVCTFGPWLDAHMLEFGFSCTRHNMPDLDSVYSFGPFDECNNFTWKYSFVNTDCHFLEMPFVHSDGLVDPNVRWGTIYIGKRLWGVKSLKDPGLEKIEQFMGMPSFLH
jgi:hypothetical protein